MDDILKLRLKHDKEHRDRYNYPPAWCPLCKEEAEKLDPNYKETKKKVEDAVIVSHLKKGEE